MVEETDTGWMTVLEKNGLGPAAEILENYGIDSETEVVQCLDRGGRGGMVEGVGVWYLYEIAL
jgi:hypothetical protein